MVHQETKLIWLRDYFTDAEIEEYRDSIFKKYFKKAESGKGKKQKLSREGTRRGNSAVKASFKKKREGT